MRSFVNGDLYMNLEQNRVFGTVRLKNHQTFHDNLSILKKIYKVNYYRVPNKRPFLINDHIDKKCIFNKRPVPNCRPGLQVFQTQLLTRSTNFQNLIVDQAYKLLKLNCRPGHQIFKI